MWLLWLHLAGPFLFVGIAMCRVLLYVVGDEKYT